MFDPRPLETDPSEFDNPFGGQGGGETPDEIPDTPEETTQQPTEEASQPPPQPGQEAESPPLSDEAILDALIDIERAGGRTGKMRVREAVSEVRSLRQALNTKHAQLLDTQRRWQEAEAARGAMPRPQQTGPYDRPPGASRSPQQQAQHPYQPDEASYLETDPAAAAHIAELRQEIDEVKSWKSQFEAQQAQAFRQQETAQAFQEFDGMARQAIQSEPIFKTFEDQFIYRGIADYTVRIIQSDPARYGDDPKGAMQEAIGWLAGDLRERDARHLKQMQAGAQDGRKARVQGAGGESPLPQKKVPQNSTEFEAFLDEQADDMPRVLEQLEKLGKVRR